MINRIPKSALSLMTMVYRKIFPAVDLELARWQERAERISNEELKKQAITSMKTKRFHCQGGSVYALLAGERWEEAIRFIVAYQTISDYLDNLCDRSTSMDPNDFRLLHQAMIDALTPDNKIKNYYAFRFDQEDEGYLADLVRTCQEALRNVDGYSIIQFYLLKLEAIYGDLQVHKHVKVEERFSRLTSWYEQHKKETPSLSWYEFSAAAGSTLGIFCLVGYSYGREMTEDLASKIYHSYFPYMQGLHILLDYYIDQQEDFEAKDLNFCSYYPNTEKMKERFIYFIERANKHIQILPDQLFHEMIHHGLIGLYLGDPKVKKLTGGIEVRKDLLKTSGNKARFFHWNTKLYYRMKPGKAE